MYQEAQPIDTFRNELDKGHHAVNVCATKIDYSNEVKGNLQIDPVSMQSGGNKLNAYDSQRTTVSFVDQGLQRKISAQGTAFTLTTVGKNGTKDLKTEKVPPKIKATYCICNLLKEAFNGSVCKTVNLIANKNCY